VNRAFPRRLLLANGAVLVVITLVAVTALAALRSTGQQLEQARQIDHRLMLLDRLRNDSRELGLSARRYMLTGDLKEQQRVLAIVHEMKKQRAELDARTSLAKGGELEADLDEYIASLTNAMSFDDDDPIARLSRFEDALERARNPLSLTFGAIMSRERERREDLRSAHSLARGAQWAVLIASALGALLLIGGSLSVLRQLRSVSGGPFVSGSRSLQREPLDAATLLDRAVRDHRAAALERGIRLRYEAQLAITVVADRERMQHVLDSLLQTAIAAAHRSSELVVHVARFDSGIRFAIIEPGPYAVSDDEIDLQLSRRVVEAHGGRIGIQTSAVSRTYWLTLPTEPMLSR
jgi:signal transduction histidine kinase